MGTEGDDEWDPLRLGNLVFLSARPHVYKDVSENVTYQKFRWLQETRGLHTSPTLLAGMYVRCGTHSCVACGICCDFNFWINTIDFFYFTLFAQSLVAYGKFCFCKNFFDMYHDSPQYVLCYFFSLRYGNITF